MKTEHRLQIDAPPSLVWNVTIDVERWSEWSPTVLSVKRVDEGPFGIGSSALIRQPGLPETAWIVSEFTRGERFTWQTRVRGMRMIGTHELTPVGGGTASVLRLEVHGLAAALLWPLIRIAAHKSLEQENLGLKARCEGLRTRKA